MTNNISQKVWAHLHFSTAAIQDIFLTNLKDLWSNLKSIFICILFILYF